MIGRTHELSGTSSSPLICGRRGCGVLDVVGRELSSTCLCLGVGWIFVLHSGSSRRNGRPLGKKERRRGRRGSWGWSLRPGLFPPSPTPHAFLNDRLPSRAQALVVMNRRMVFSFSMDGAARIPWIAFAALAGAEYMNST